MNVVNQGGGHEVEAVMGKAKGPALHGRCLLLWASVAGHLVSAH